MTNPNPCRLYAITPPRLVLAEFMPRAEQAFAGGDIACLQLRLKEASEKEIRKAAEALLPLCHAHEAALILNDNLELACELPVDGVHLGQEDLYNDWGACPPKPLPLRAGPVGPVEETIPLKNKERIAAIRQQLGEEKILGITCHASKHLAMEAGEQGADYVAFGAFYPTASKPKEKLEKWGTPAPDILRFWAEGSTLPCVAIGGITPQNCAPLVRAGADFIAVITGIWDHREGPAAAVKAYNAAIKEALAAAENA